MFVTCVNRFIADNKNYNTSANISYKTLKTHTIHGLHQGELNSKTSSKFRKYLKSYVILAFSRNFHCQSLYCSSIKMPKKGRLTATEKQRIVAVLTEGLLIKILVTEMKKGYRNFSYIHYEPQHQIQER